MNIQKILSFSLVLIFPLLINQATAQCPGCVVDPTCPATLPGGGICPAVQADGNAGQYYDEDVTFYMPVDVIDPLTGVAVELQQIEVTAISGLPIGIDWTLNHANHIYTPPTGDTLGCLKFCGTPIIPALYNIVVFLDATAYVPSYGVTITVPKTYETTIHVLAGSGGSQCMSFSPS